MVRMPDRDPPVTSPAGLPQALTAAIERAGYYPELVADVVAAALGPDEVISHLVHQETTFDHDSVRRHVTVLALTEQRLVIAHADDHGPDPAPEPDDAGSPDGAALAVETTEAVATATTESVPLRTVRGLMLTHVVGSPATYQPGSLGRELTLSLGWGAVSRVDLVPATCGDPDCEADHGYEGTISADDISLRISADAEGQQALTQAIGFARALSARIGQ